MKPLIGITMNLEIQRRESEHPRSGLRQSCAAGGGIPVPVIGIESAIPISLSA
jgi:hypothetical protein